MRGNDTVDYDRAFLRGFTIGFVLMPVVTGAIVAVLAFLMSLGM
jgi:hypothetical protein